MKKMLAVLVFAVLVIGCVGGNTTNPINYLYPINEKSICTTPEYQTSIICKTMASIGQTPEQFNDMLLDASVIGLMTKMWDKEQLKAAFSVLRQFTASEATMTFEKLIGFMEKRADVDPYMKMLLSRKLGQLKVPQFYALPFSPQDKSMVIYALDSQEAQL